MLPYAFYLLKVILCSGILFGYYWLLLRNKIFHHYNRFYLLAAVVLSLLLPLLEVDIWQSAGQPAPQAIKILQVVSSDEYLDEIVVMAGPSNITAEQILLVCYSAICIGFFSLFIVMLTKIRMLFTRHRHRRMENIYFVNTTAKGTPFSFLKYIFWNDHIDPETTVGRQIFKHELAHVRQGHSYDKLLMQAVLIFFWCNPFFWLIRKELNMIHEFVADQIAVEDSDTEAFAAMILQATYPQHHFQLTNPFFYSPIKRRLLMLAKNKKSKTGYIGRILVLPLAAVVFAAFTLKAKTLIVNDPTVYNGKKITVVVDAGHGGSDNGVMSAAGGVAEKDLNLAIIKKIKSLNHNASINLVLTRENDIYQSPRQKADFTKEHHADLFISIHADGATKEKAGLLSGMSVWVAKDNYANSNDSKLFASAIINEFSKGYKLPVSSNPQQQKTGVMVLQESPCPSVLVEAGYITNSNDLAFLQTDAAKEIIAGKILAAIEKYGLVKENGTGGVAIRTAVRSDNFIESADTTPVVNIKGTADLLIIIDGKNSTQKQLKAINPDNIQSVTVLKNAAAVAEYGDKAKKGVVLVITKEKDAAMKNLKVVTHANDTTSEMQLTATHIQINLDKIIDPKPVFIINGKVQNDGFDLKSIQPDDIERIDVLKGKSALDKYGDKAVNGAIEITTKNVNGAKELPVSSSSEKSENGATVVKYNDGKEGLTGSYKKNNVDKLYPPGATVTSQDQAQDKIFTKVENEPNFPGGDSAWRNYLVKNLNADLPIKEGWKPGVYKIVLTFIVGKNGAISDIKADNYAGTKTAEHCIDLIKKGPDWDPAVQNGHTVNCYRKQPITFVVP